MQRAQKLEKGMAFDNSVSMTWNIINTSSEILERAKYLKTQTFAQEIYTFFWYKSSIQ